MKRFLNIIAVALFASAVVAIANRYEDLSVGKLTVESSISGSSMTFSAEDISSTDDITAADTTTTSNLQVTARSAITPYSVSTTNTGAIAHSGHSLVYVTITDAAVGTNTVAAPTVDGSMLEMVNVGTGTVEIADSGNVALSADITLGQYDTLSLRGCLTGVTQWLQRATSDN